MTTPTAHPPTQVPFGLGGTAVQAWASNPGATSILFFNQDIANTIYLGYASDLQIGASNAWPLAPLTSINMDGTKTIYAVATTGTANLLVLPSGANPTLSVSALTEAFIASGLAVQIAQAIAQSGISLTGSPILLYNGSIQSTAGTPAGFGTNFSDNVPAAYGCSGGNSIAAFQCAYNAFDGFITPQKDTASKLFNNPRIFPLSPTNKMQAAINQGHKLYLCYQPGSQVDAFGTVINIIQVTADQNALLASVNAMIAACAAAGTGASVAAVVLYQEYNNQSSAHTISATQYQAGWNYYANSLHASLPGLKICACLGSGNHDNWNTYINSGLTFISGLGIDYYASASIAGGGNVLLDSGNNGGAPVAGINNNIIAIATALGIPWSVMELGRRASPNAPLPSTTQMANYLNYIAGVVKTWVTNGNNMLDCMWFNGQAGEANVISSAADPLVAPPANLLQNFIASITSTPITGIAAGATAILPALNPSPVAGYAIANGLSYDITVNLTASPSSTVPFAAVQLSWFNSDALNAQPVSVQQWTLPAGTTGTAGTFTIGAGPQRGQFLQVQVTNLDTVQMSVTIQINATSRTVDRDDWFWDVGNSVTVPTFFLSNVSAPYSNQLAMHGTTTVVPGTPFVRLCAVYAGEVYVRFNASGVSVMQVQLNPTPQNKGGGGVWLGGSALLNETPNGEFETIIVTPRCPLQLTVTNNDTVNRTFSFEMVARK